MDIHLKISPEHATFLKLMGERANLTPVGVVEHVMYGAIYVTALDFAKNLQVAHEDQVLHAAARAIVLHGPTPRGGE